MYICILYRLASVGHIPSVFLCQWDHGKIGKDYEMHAICLWAPLDSVQQRGNQRSLKACAMSTPCLRHAQCGDLEWFQIYGRPGKFSTKNGSSERLVLQCLKYPSSQQLELLQGDMYIYIYMYTYICTGWLSQLSLSNWKCENMCHHRATDQLGPPHGQAGKAFTPKFHTPSWLLAPLSWGAGKTASNRRGHVTFLNSVSKRRTDLEENDNLHHTKKKQPSGRF